MADDNAAPTITIRTPLDGSYFMLDRGISLMAEVVDREDAPADLAIEWIVELVREGEVDRVLYQGSGLASSFVVESLPDARDLWVRVRATVTDSGQLTDTAVVRMLPRADAGSAYPLGPGDVLEVSVYAGGDRQETFTAEVSSTGTVITPLIGEVDVLGLTAAQLSEKMTFLLGRDFFVDPQVLVSLRDHARKIYIAGEVKSPGAYRIPDGSTVLNACILAGGFTDFAQLRKVTVTRSDGTQSRLITVDLSKVQAGKVEDLVLRPGDRVDVPHRTF